MFAWRLEPGRYVLSELFPLDLILTLFFEIIISRFEYFQPFVRKVYVKKDLTASSDGENNYGSIRT